MKYKRDGKRDGGSERKAGQRGETERGQERRTATRAARREGPREKGARGARQVLIQPLTPDRPPPGGKYW